MILPINVGSFLYKECDKYFTSNYRCINWYNAEGKEIRVLEKFPKSGAPLESIVDFSTNYRFVVCGIVTYNGMSAEQFVLVWLRSKFIEPIKVKFEAGTQ